MMTNDVHAVFNTGHMWQLYTYALHLITYADVEIDIIWHKSEQDDESQVYKDTSLVWPYPL